MQKTYWVNGLQKNKEKLMSCKYLAMRTEQSSLLRNAIGRDYTDGNIQKLQKDKKGFEQGTDHFNSLVRGKNSTEHKNRVSRNWHLKNNNKKRTEQNNRHTWLRTQLQREI